jgi:transposase
MPALLSPPQVFKPKPMPGLQSLRGTRMSWEWVLVSNTAVLHRIRPSRGRDVITEVVGEHRPRCWISDRWSAQQGHADTHQVCLAHVLRDVQYTIDAGEPHFAPALRRLLCWAVAVGPSEPEGIFPPMKVP